MEKNTPKGFRGDQAAVITVGDSLWAFGDVPNLQTAELVKNDIFIRSDGLLANHVLHECPASDEKGHTMCKAFLPYQYKRQSPLPYFQ